MPTTEYKTYPGRFYVLVVTALLAMHQNIAWLTFGPIPEQAKQEYGLTDVELTLLPEYSPIAFMLLTVPFTWFLFRFGLNVSGVGGAWMLAVGCGIRCFIPYMPNAHQWIWVMHIGHILIGIVGMPIMIMPSKLSAVWFPANHRSLATAFTTSAEGFGGGLGYIFITYLTEQCSIRTMLYVQAEVALFIAILATIYFPSKPPTPPSASAKEDRIGFLEAIKKLMCNRNFILLCLSGGSITGGVFAFGMVIGIVLNPSSGFNNLIVVHSMDEFFYSVAWMGAFSSIAGTIVGQLTGFFADRFQQRFKLILLILLGLATAFSLWFSLSIYGYVSHNPINIFVSYMIVNILTLASFPIFYEAIVECTYPVSEGTSVAGLAFTTNAFTLLFGIIGMSHVFSDAHPNRAKAMVWVTTGLAAMATLLVLLYTDKYHRLKVDKQSTPVPSIQGQHISPPPVYSPEPQVVASTVPQQAHTPVKSIKAANGQLGAQTPQLSYAESTPTETSALLVKTH